jgi:amidase
MAVRPPGKDEVAALAASYGMHPSDADLETYTLLVGGALS